MHRIASILSMFTLLVSTFTLLVACKAGGEGAASGLPEVPIAVDASGYHPAEASAPAGQKVRLVFTRTSDEGCGQQLVFPALGIRKDLPLGEAVAVDITMPPSGAVHFTCGMDMYRGSVVGH